MITRNRDCYFTLARIKSRNEFAHKEILKDLYLAININKTTINYLNLNFLYCYFNLIFCYFTLSQSCHIQQTNPLQYSEYHVFRINILLDYINIHKYLHINVGIL